MIVPSLTHRGYFFPVCYQLKASKKERKEQARPLVLLYYHLCSSRIRHVCTIVKTCVIVVFQRRSRPPGPIKLPPATTDVSRTEVEPQVFFHSTFGANPVVWVMRDLLKCIVNVGSNRWLFFIFLKKRRGRMLYDIGLYLDSII